MKKIRKDLTRKELRLKELFLDLAAVVAMEICSKTATRMQAMMRASNYDNNNQETEKEMPKLPESTVLGYFEDDKKDNFGACQKETDG